MCGFRISIEALWPLYRTASRHLCHEMWPLQLVMLSCHHAWRRCEPVVTADETVRRDAAGASLPPSQRSSAFCPQSLCPACPSQPACGKIDEGSDNTVRRTVQYQILYSYVWCVLPVACLFVKFVCPLWSKTSCEACESECEMVLFPHNHGTTSPKAIQPTRRHARLVGRITQTDGTLALSPDLTLEQSYTLFLSTTEKTATDHD